MTNTPEPVQTVAGESVLRVSDLETGHHYTIVADAYDSKRHRLLKSPALDSYGYPAPPKFKAAKGSPEAADDADGAVYDGTDETQQEAQ